MPHPLGRGTSLKSALENHRNHRLHERLSVHTWDDGYLASKQPGGMDAMKWIRWMQSPWLSRVIAALMSLSMGTPAVWAYGDQLRPFASAQQPAIPFQLT